MLKYYFFEKNSISATWKIFIANNTNIFYSEVYFDAYLLRETFLSLSLIDTITPFSFHH